MLVISPCDLMNGEVDDAIGVRDVPDAQDEYGGYGGGIYRLLANGASVEDLANHLAQIEQNAMGLSAHSKTLLVARQLREIDLSLDPKRSS